MMTCCTKYSSVFVTAKQQEADVKRLKLSYAELGTCDEEANDTWDLIMSQAQANPTQKCDIQLLNSAILRGNIFNNIIHNIL